MEADRWQRVCDVFEAARRVDGQEREALLHAASDVADDVRELLGHHDEPTGALDAPGADTSLGAEIGSYRITGVLGQGGMGTVYLAEGPDGAVALKRLHPQLKAEASIWQRFQREAELGARIRHPNVVRSMGLLDDEYLVMERVEGRTLRELIEKTGALSESRCREIALAIARALVAIHEAGAVHRDLKPANVIVTPEGLVKVMDLGIALPLDDLLRLSATGQFVGTVRYSAPEQLEGGKPVIDGRADLYALGLMLYELAAGEHPLPPGGLVSTMRAHLTTTPPPLSERCAEVSPFFEGLVHTLLAKAPDDRLASAAELVRVLEEGV